MNCGKFRALVFMYLKREALICNPVVKTSEQISKATGLTNGRATRVISDFKKAGFIRVKKGKKLKDPFVILVCMDYKLVRLQRPTLKWQTEIVLSDSKDIETEEISLKDVLTLNGL